MGILECLAAGKLFRTGPHTALPSLSFPGPNTALIYSSEKSLFYPAWPHCNNLPHSSEDIFWATMAKIMLGYVRYAKEKTEGDLIVLCRNKERRQKEAAM